MKITAEEFNSTLSIGDDIIYTDDFGREHKTKTRSGAWELGHGDAAVMMEGRSGSYSVDRIKAL